MGVHVEPEVVVEVVAVAQGVSQLVEIVHAQDSPTSKIIKNVKKHE